MFKNIETKIIFKKNIETKIIFEIIFTFFGEIFLNKKMLITDFFMHLKASSGCKAC